MSSPQLHISPSSPHNELALPPYIPPLQDDLGMFDEYVEEGLSNLLTKNPNFDEIYPNFTSKCRILSIWLQNFKSYDGFHQIGPFGQHTAIIGPNGAGKSNLMDAISFVLGISSNFLRSQNLKENIHRKEGETEEEITDRGASVGIIIEEFSNENKNKEIQFHRQISSKGVASFYIDSRRVPQADYIQKLHTYNILVKAKNFLVFQGDVQEIAQKDPKELSSLFEHVSNSETLRESYDNAFNEWKKQQNDVRHIFVQKRQLENELKAMSKQREEAEQYQQTYTDLNNTTAEHLLFRLFVNESLGNEWEEKKTQIIEQREIRENEINEKKLELLKNEKNKLNFQNLFQKTEISIKNKQTLLDTLLPELAEINETKKFFRQKTENLEIQKQTTKTQVDVLSKYIEETTKGIEEIEKQLKNTQQALEEALIENNIQMTNKQTYEYQQLDKRLFEQTADKQITLKNIHAQIRRQQLAVDTCEHEIEDLYRKKAKTETSINEGNQKISEILQKIEQNNKQITQNEEEITQSSTLLQTSNETRKTLIQNLQSVDEQLKTLLATNAEITHKLQRDRLVHDLQETFDVVYGYLTDLCTPTNKRYSSAILAALGKYNETIVTDTFTTATHCVEYLKRHRLGRLEFLPINFQKKQKNFEIFSKFQNAKLAIDCLQFEEQFRPLFNMVLEDTYIVDNLEEAKHLFYNKKQPNLRLKFVTLNGEKILKNGNMAIDNNRGDWLNKFDMREQTNLEKRKQTIIHQLREIEELEMNGSSKCAHKRRENERFERKNVEMSTKLEIWKKQIKILENEQTNLENNYQTSKNNKQTALHTLQQTIQQSQQVEKEIKEIEDVLFFDLSNEFGEKNIRNLSKNIEKAKLQKCQNEAKFAHKLSQLQADKKELVEKMSNLTKIDQIEFQIKTTNEEIQNLQQKLSNKQTNITQLEEEIKEEKQNLEQISIQRKEIDNKLQSSREAIQAKMKEADRCTAKVADIEAKIDSANQQARLLLHQSLLENVQIPLEAGTIEDIRALSNGNEPKNDILFDYTTLPPSVHREIKKKEKIKELDENYEKKIEELKKFRQKISPNFKAKQKCEEMQTQAKHFDDFANTKRKECQFFEKKFKKIQNERAKRFLDCFEHVKAAIDRIYSNLTIDEENNEMGGKAFLDLDDIFGVKREDDPFLCGIRYHAMPPSARFRHMHLLSGGEKTMAALALLFALQSYNPSPFFVLDEVDAALDPKNVSALAKYLNKAPFQSIVISLKDKLFSQMDVLIGVLKQKHTDSSKHIVLNLGNYRGKEKEEGIDTETDIQTHMHTHRNSNENTHINIYNNNTHNNNIHMQTYSNNDNTHTYTHTHNYIPSTLPPLPPPTTPPRRTSNRLEKLP